VYVCRSLVVSSVCADLHSPLFPSTTLFRSLTRLARLGVKPIAIPLDRDGMRTDVLATVLADLKDRGIRPKYIYTIPTVQNPTGTIMPESRRAELLWLSRAYGVPVFVDDCYYDLILVGKRTRVIYGVCEHVGVMRLW